MGRDEGFRHGCRGLVAEFVGHGGDVPLVHDDAVGETAAADDAEDALPDLEAVRLSGRTRSPSRRSRSPECPRGEPGGAG